MHRALLCTPLSPLIHINAASSIKLGVCASVCVMFCFSVPSACEREYKWKRKREKAVQRFSATRHPSTYFLINFGSCNLDQSVCVHMYLCVFFATMNACLCLCVFKPVTDWLLGSHVQSTQGMFWQLRNSRLPWGACCSWQLSCVHFCLLLSNLKKHDHRQRVKRRLGVFHMMCRQWNIDSPPPKPSSQTNRYTILFLRTSLTNLLCSSSPTNRLHVNVCVNTLTACLSPCPCVQVSLLFLP